MIARHSPVTVWHIFCGRPEILSSEMSGSLRRYSLSMTDSFRPVSVCTHEARASIIFTFSFSAMLPRLLEKSNPFFKFFWKNPGAMLQITNKLTNRSDILWAEPLALSPRSSGTNIRTSPKACSNEVPGLRTFLSQPVTSARLGRFCLACKL